MTGWMNGWGVPSIGGGGGGGAFAKGVFLNGTSPTYLQKSPGPFSGAVNSHQITLSFWFRMNGAGGDGLFRILFEHATQAGLNLFFDNSNFLSVTLGDTSGVATVGVNTAGVATFTSADTSWHHCYTSLDNTSTSGGGGTLGGMVLDGSPVAGGFTQSSSNPFAFADTSAINLGARGAGSLPCFMDIAALWIDQGHYHDPAVAANVQKFRSLSGHPVDLGADGSTPFGYQPIAFFDNPPSTFGTNLGSGGNLTLQSGTLTASSSSP